MDDSVGWKTGMIDKVREARAAGVNQVVVFPKTPDNLKSAGRRRPLTHSTRSCVFASLNSTRSRSTEVNTVVVHG